MPINIDITLKSSKWLKHKTFFNKVLKNRINDILLHFPNLVDKEIELSIVVANNRIVGNLNKKYRKIDKTTNVLSFSSHNDLLKNIPNTPIIHLGDIILSYEQVFKESQEQEKKFYDHITHLIFHSFLHLLGYSHCKEKERLKMEKLEIEFLNKIKIKNPYI
jgi:probable rRNA maturation factor